MSCQSFSEKVIIAFLLFFILLLPLLSFGFLGTLKRYSCMPLCFSSRTYQFLIVNDQNIVQLHAHCCGFVLCYALWLHIYYIYTILMNWTVNFQKPIFLYTCFDAEILFFWLFHIQNFTFRIK